MLRIALVKSLTSGQGAEIPACRKYGHPFKFRPQVSFLLDSNYLLKVDSPDWGTWRRIRVIPFDQKIPTLVKDPHIASKLWAERPGIFNLVIQALRRYNARGRVLEVPDAVKLASGKYEQDSDLLAQFIDDQCAKGEGKSIKLRDFTNAYKNWAQNVTTKRKARIGERQMEERLNKERYTVTYDRQLRVKIVEDLALLFETHEMF